MDLNTYVAKLGGNTICVKLVRSTYTEHAATAGQGAAEVAALRDSRRTVVEGSDLKPIRAFEHAGGFGLVLLLLVLLLEGADVMTRRQMSWSLQDCRKRTNQGSSPPAQMLLGLQICPLTCSWLRHVPQGLGRSCCRPRRHSPRRRRSSRRPGRLQHQVQDNELFEWRIWWVAHALTRKAAS